MDSKNLIWLSSFFSLLFITFCVTRHLDDLNPKIISMPRESQEINAELDAVNLDNDIQHSFAPKLETPKLETPKLIKEKTELFTSEELQKVVTKKENTFTKVAKKLLKKEKPQIIKKSKKVKKQKIIIKKAKRIKQKTTTTKTYTIGGINLDTVTMQAIFSHKNNNELNKLAYMHSIHKGSTIQIYTNDVKIAKHLIGYLQKQNVQKKDIHIHNDKTVKNLIKITLIGRK